VKLNKGGISMNKEHYKDTGKLTNFHYGSEKNQQTAQISSQQTEQSVTHEQVSDTLTEGTIDYKIEQNQQK
jgi:hypothetical protein